MPAAVMVTREAHLPPSSSWRGSVPPSKNWMKRVSCTSGLPGDGDAHRRAEGEVVAERDGVGVDQAQPRREPGHLLDGDPGLQLGEHVAQAVVDAEAEGEVLA